MTVVMCKRIIIVIFNLGVVFPVCSIMTNCVDFSASYITKTSMLFQYLNSKTWCIFNAITQKWHNESGV